MGILPAYELGSGRYVLRVCPLLLRWRRPKEKPLARQLSPDT